MLGIVRIQASANILTYPSILIILRLLIKDFHLSEAGYKKMVRPRVRLNNVDASNPLFLWLCAIGVMFKSHLLHVRRPDSH